MAEYVTKEQVKEKIMEIEKPCDDRLDYYIDSSNLEDEIDNIKPADVIERSEYERLKQENRELAIKYDNAMNMVINEQENFIRLRSKIDKAIEELQNMKVYDRTKTARLVSLPEVFEILKKNIGE